MYTVHVAHVEVARGDAFVMPVGPKDSTSYANLSQGLLQGHFAEVGEEYEYFHTPGYPAFVVAILFATGGSFFAVTFVQILLVFAIALMTYVLGARLLSPHVGQWASLLFLVNPLVPSIALYVLTDILFTFLLTLGFLLLVVVLPKRTTTATILAGIVFAAAIYVRPIGTIAFPIFIAPVFAAAIPWRKKLLCTVGILVIILVLMVPWMLRNKEHSGVFSFSSLFSLNMAYYEIPHYFSWYQGIGLTEAIQKVEQGSGVPEGSDINGYPANWYNLASAPLLDRYIYAIVFVHPIRYAIWHLYNSSAFFVNPAINPPHQSVNLKLLLAQGHIKAFAQGVLTPWWLALERTGIALGLLLLATGVWRLRRQPLAWAFLFIILYLGALGGSAAESRLRLPVEPLISIFIITGMIACVEWYEK